MTQNNSSYFESILQSHQAYIRALALRLAPLPGLSDDIAQQVFVEFIEKKDRWDLTQDVRPLLAEMTRIVAKRHWRARKKTLSVEMRELAEHIRSLAEQQDIAGYSEDDKRALRGCLEKLPEKSRRLVEIRYSLGASSVEIANQMQMHADAVRRALFRLRSQLRHCIELTLAGGRNG